MVVMNPGGEVTHVNVGKFDAGFFQCPFHECRHVRAVVDGGVFR